MAIKLECWRFIVLLSDSPDADFTMLDCPPAAPGESAADDGFGDAPAMDADVRKHFLFCR